MPKHEPEIQSVQKSPMQMAARPPWSLMDLHSEIDRLFDDFARGLGWRGFPENGSVGRIESAVPEMAARVNIAETDSAYEIEAELPALDEKDIELTVAEGVLMLSGERKEQKEEKRKNYHLVERSYGSFRRSFALPQNIVEDKIDAKFSKGVLKITLPKEVPGTAKPGEKRIAIKVE